MSRIWITSDNHFSHKNIHKFCPKTRPDENWEVMNERMIARWQEQVSSTDTVYMLGDVFFCNSAEAIRIMERLPGHKHLVYGNHDNAIRGNSTLRGMFESINEYREVRVNGTDVIMFHYPIQEWNKMHRGSVNVYGHIHHAVSGVPGRTINVCVDSPELFDENNPYSLFDMSDVLKVALAREIMPHHGRTIL